MTIHRYVSESAPTLELRLKDADLPHEKDLVVKFADKILRLDDSTAKGAECVALLDTAIADKINIRQLVKKMNMSAAEKIVAEHRATTDQQQGMVKGAVSGADLARARLTVTIEDTAVRMRAQGVSEEQITATLAELAAEHGLEIPVTGDAPASTPSDGVLLDKGATTARQIESVSGVKTDGGAAPKVNIPAGVKPSPFKLSLTAAAPLPLMAPTEGQVVREDDAAAASVATV